MVDFLKYLEGFELRHIVGGEAVVLDDDASGVLSIAINPSALNIRVTAQNRAARLVLVRGEGSCDADVEITIDKGAKLHLVDVMCNFNKSALTIKQSADSVLQSTLLQLTASEIDCRIDLDGEGAETEFNILQLPTAKERTACDLRISHMVAHCTSRSKSKCVAGGASVGEFHGLVYVAQDAQQTLSEQNSCNVALSSEARIIAEPQLEIYADDVKCTHGATVGQMDRDAILYMRQRGLSEDQARKVQLDGFVADVTMACAIEELQEPLIELVRERLNEL